MTTQTDPCAMVLPDTDAQRGLLALGWTTTDIMDGWHHMEPPLGRPVVITTGSDSDVETARVSRLDLQEGDGVIVTAPDIDAADVEALREQVDALLAGDQDCIIANFDIHMQAIGRPEGVPDLSTAEDHAREALLLVFEAVGLDYDEDHGRITEIENIAMLLMPVGPDLGDLRSRLQALRTS